MQSLFLSLSIASISFHFYWYKFYILHRLRSLNCPDIISTITVVFLALNAIHRTKIFHIYISFPFFLVNLNHSKFYKPVQNFTVLSMSIARASFRFVMRHSCVKFVFIKVCKSTDKWHIMISQGHFMYMYYILCTYHSMWFVWWFRFPICIEICYISIRLIELNDNHLETNGSKAKSIMFWGQFFVERWSEHINNIKDVQQTVCATNSKRRVIWFLLFVVRLFVCSFVRSW